MEEAKAAIIGGISNAVIEALKQYMFSGEDEFDPILVPTGVIHALMIISAAGADNVDAFETLLKAMRGMLSMERSEARSFFESVNQVKGKPA
jgi:hypothetical protein